MEYRVIDDGSSDATCGILSEFDGRIQWGESWKPRPDGDDQQGLVASQGGRPHLA